MRRQVPMIQDETQKDQKPEEMQISLRTKCRQRPEIHGEQSGTTAEKVMPDVRDARVRKRATSETFSRSRYTAFSSFSRSRAAGRLGREAWQGGPAGKLSRKAPTKRSQKEVACESDKRDRDTPFSQRSQFTQWCWTTQWEYPMRTERQRDQGPRSGRVSQKVSSESADQVVVNNRTGAGPATTP